MTGKPAGRRWIVGLAVALFAVLLYSRGARHEFVFDDGLYITTNPQVLQGLSWPGAAWALTTFTAGNWHPLTWLSHMADIQLFGTRPGAHHLVSAGLHALSALALCIGLAAMTGALWPSALVATLFAVHPLHVESAAWVAERKDVLAGLFAALTLVAYLRYARRPSAGRYLTAAATFALGLMAKPTVVTLPFLLLLLDFWPLGRLCSRGAAAPRRKEFSHPAVTRPRPFLEKLPLVALAVGVSFLTYLAQTRGENVSLMEPHHSGVRLANISLSYLAYLGKTFWPAGLGCFYPLPTAEPAWWLSAGIAALLAGVTGLLFAVRARAPYLITGWLWYLGTLVPMIGLVRVGLQAFADRYTYLPLTGVFIAVAWAGAALARRRDARAALSACGAVAVLALSACAWRQIGYWRDGVSLFGRALAVTSGDNWLAVANLGSALVERGRETEASRLYTDALRRNNNQPHLHYNLAQILDGRGQAAEAAAHYRETLRLLPTNTKAHINLGIFLAQQGRFEEALVHHEQAVRSEPTNAEARYNLGLTLLARERYREAATQLSETLRLNPGFVQARPALREALRLGGGGGPGR